MHRKKIVHIIQSLDSGGCENMLLRTLPLLTDSEHIVITLNHIGELAEKFQEKNISIINIGQKSFSDVPSYGRLLKTVRNIKPDLIITYLFHADAIGRLFLQTFPCHSRESGKPVSIIPFLRTTYNHRKYLLARLFEKTTKYFVKQYLANSESVKDFYVKNIGVAPEKITIIPNGIDVAYYENISRNENLRKNLGINADEIVIICVANLYINKGHKYLLEAFEEVCCHSRENGKPIPHLLLVGEGEEKENLKNKIENYQSKNNILFLGKRNDIPQLLKVSDIFVLPTLFEGMSNAIMEAMASGLPVITTDIAENKELIKNKKNGILVPPKNVKAIAKEIIILANDKETRIELGRAAKVSMRDEFGLEKVSEGLKNVLIKTC